MNELADRLYQQMLVVRCQAGDRAALEELIAGTQPRLRAFLHKMLPQHADDLAQEIWMDVYRDLPALADPGAFLPWLYRIAHHRIFRLLRGRRRAMSDIENLDVADDEPADFTAEDAQAVHAAMDQLEPAHREVLLLKFIQNMSYEQIAMVIQRPIGTVRSRVHHAKRQLKIIIERQISHEPK